MGQLVQLADEVREPSWRAPAPSTPPKTVLPEGRALVAFSRPTSSSAADGPVDDQRERSEPEREPGREPLVEAEDREQEPDHREAGHEPGAEHAVSRNRMSHWSRQAASPAIEPEHESGAWSAADRRRPAGRPPNFRWRAAKARQAASRSSPRKSGQRTSVTQSSA